MDVVNQIRLQIRLHGEKITDQKVVEKMMVSVPQKVEEELSELTSKLKHKNKEFL